MGAALRSGRNTLLVGIALRNRLRLGASRRESARSPPTLRNPPKARVVRQEEVGRLTTSKLSAADSRMEEPVKAGLALTSLPPVARPTVSSKAEPANRRVAARRAPFGGESALAVRQDVHNIPIREALKGPDHVRYHPLDQRAGQMLGRAVVTLERELETGTMGRGSACSVC